MFRFFRKWFGRSETEIDLAAKHDFERRNAIALGHAVHPHSYDQPAGMIVRGGSVTGCRVVGPGAVGIIAHGAKIRGATIIGYDTPIIADETTTLEDITVKP